MTTTILKIIESHVEYDKGSLGSAVIHVACESDPGKFIAFTGRINQFPEYAVRHVSSYGKELSAEDARRIFPELSKSLSYAEQPVERTKQNPLISLSDLYERGKDLIMKISNNPSDDATTELLGVLRSIRDISAPAIVKSFPEAEKSHEG